MQKIVFSNARMMQGVIACKILVAADNVVFLHMFIANVSVRKELNGPLNIRLYHKCRMV